MPWNELFRLALSLPEPERADLAFQLLQSLSPPGEVSPEQFGAELHEKIDVYRRGETLSYSLPEAREIVKRRLLQERAT